MIKGNQLIFMGYYTFYYTLRECIWTSPQLEKSYWTVLFIKSTFLRENNKTLKNRQINIIAHSGLINSRILFLFSFEKDSLKEGDISICVFEHEHFLQLEFLKKTTLFTATASHFTLYVLHTLQRHYEVDFCQTRL